jgi:hypothetical protein
VNCSSAWLRGSNNFPLQRQLWTGLIAGQAVAVIRERSGGTHYKSAHLPI